VKRNAWCVVRGAWCVVHFARRLGPQIVRGMLLVSIGVLVPFDRFIQILQQLLKDFAFGSAAWN
jgi:hypothetical protein